MMRLFTGLELPDGIRDELPALSQPLPGVHWIDDDDLHLTLRFAGDVDRRTAADFADALSLIDQPVFELRIIGLATFGGNDPRVLYAVLAPSVELEALARTHERAARSAGVPAEKRAFKPHITLARLSHVQIDDLAKFLQLRGGYRSKPFVVEQFVLFSSKPRTGGGPYVVEQGFPLAGATPSAYEDWQTG